jgi:lysophospholipase L1-like esterase
MKTVLCYGDSNTWGAVPMASWDDRRRYAPAERWTGVMQAALGPDWQVIAEGLPGRTSAIEDPVEGAHLSGLTHFRPCLESHRPIDLIVLMLGTNDFKRRLGLEAEDVAIGIGRLFEELRVLGRFGDKRPPVVLISPPPIEAVGIFETMYAGAGAKSKQLAPLLKSLAAANGALFLDAGQIIASSPIDGIHLGAAAHAALGSAAARAAAQAMALFVSQPTAD